MASRAVVPARNDNSPDFADGSATDRQITAERSVLFTRVLTGLGVSRQAQRFIWILYCLSKPGKLYHFNDYRLAEHLGCADSPTSRNYVCNLRKKLKEWNAGTYNDHGTRHYSFVSIEENTYNFKTKQQNPTGYQVSKEFADLLDNLHAQVKLHPAYKDSWLRAISEVCAAAAARSELKEYGFWNERKEKRPRTVEDIIGTLLLNYKRLTAKIFIEAKRFGIPTDLLAAEMIKIAPGYINLAKYQAMAHYGPINTIRVPGAPLGPGDGGKVEKGYTGTDRDDDRVHDGQGNFLVHAHDEKTEKEFKQIWQKIFSYVANRDKPDETVIASSYKPTRLVGGENNVSSSTQQRPGDMERGDSGENRSGALPLVDRNGIPILQAGEHNNALDNSREQFVERVQNRSRDNPE